MSHFHWSRHRGNSPCQAVFPDEPEVALPPDPNAPEDHETKWKGPGVDALREAFTETIGNGPAAAAEPQPAANPEPENPTPRPAAAAKDELKRRERERESAEKK